MPTLTFNHAMVYSRDVPKAVHFYADLLGFKVIEEYQGHGRIVYARLKSAGGDTTIALHQVAPGEELHPGGIRLYFEVKDLDRFCKRLRLVEWCSHRLRGSCRGAGNTLT